MFSLYRRYSLSMRIACFLILNHITKETIKMNITIENNINSNKYKYCIWSGNKTIDDSRYCIANFSNKKHAIRILNFLIWYQNRFGDFDNVNDCAARLANACNQSKINFISNV